MGGRRKSEDRPKLLSGQNFHHLQKATLITNGPRTAARFDLCNMSLIYLAFPIG